MPKPKKKMNVKDSDIVQVPVKPLFFDIKTFDHWDVKKTDRRCYILTDEEGNESFKISLSINTSLEVEMDIVYCEKVVMWRGKMSDTMKKFWHDLGTMSFYQEDGEKDQLRDIALQNYDWAMITL